MLICIGDGIRDSLLIETVYPQVHSNIALADIIAHYVIQSKHG